MQHVLESIGGTSIGNAVETSIWIFPTLEILHFIGLAMVIGGIGLLDLRMLGAVKALSPAALHRLLPMVFIGFGINLVTGVLFFLSDPVGYGTNPSFRFKMLLVLLAGLNALWFELAYRRRIADWPADYDAPRLAKLLCAMSLLLWAGVITAGRLLPSFGTLL